MQNRARRRKDAQKEKKKLEKLTRHSTSAERVKIDENGRRIVVGDHEAADYVRPKDRKRAGKVLKQISKRKLRNGRRKMEEFRGSDYKKMTVDIEWQYR